MMKENNHSNRPPPEEIHITRGIPVRYETDILVVGGGIAGSSAAAAAAASGARVMLIERFATPGGDLTIGGVFHFMYTLSKGEVLDHILTDMKAFRAVNPATGVTKPNGVCHGEILAIVLIELLRQRGVKLLLHTRFVEAQVKHGKITECIICGKSGLEAIRARQVIDASGDGDVARYAGFEVMKGRPSDGAQLPMSMMYFVRHVEPKDAHVQLPDGWYNPVRKKEDLPMITLWPDGPRSNAIKMKVPGFDSTDTESLTAAELQGRRRMMEVMHYHQAVEKRPWLLDHCSPIIGIREGCRIVGDHVLQVDDCRTRKTYDDAVAVSDYQHVDAHSPDDEGRTFILPREERWIPPFQIPLRSLIARDGKNLLIAGRCFSADQLSMSSARVSGPTSMMGQAAGIAAALSIEKNCDVRSLDHKEVQKIILERGGIYDLERYAFSRSEVVTDTSNVSVSSGS